MADETTPKRKVGRPRNPDRADQQKSRRFFPLEKTPTTIILMGKAHDVYAVKHGKRGSDAEVLRDALRQYTSE